MTTIYTINQIRSPDGVRKITPSLYAISKDKNLAKEFMRTRRDDIFHLEKIKLGKKEAWNMLDNYPEKVLFDETLHTSTKYGEINNLHMVMTTNETVKVLTKTDEFWSQLSIFTNPKVFILETEYIEILDSLGYFMAMNSLSPDVCEDLAYEIEREKMLYGDFYLSYNKPSIPRFSFDEFQIFMHYYGWTMMKKNEGGKEIAYDYIISR